MTGVGQPHLGSSRAFRAPAVGRLAVLAATAIMLVAATTVPAGAIDEPVAEITIRTRAAVHDTGANIDAGRQRITAAVADGAVIDVRAANGAVARVTVGTRAAFDGVDACVGAHC